MSDQNSKSFWTTLPGILTGVAALLTAIGSLSIALSQINEGDFPGSTDPSEDHPGGTIPLPGDTISLVELLVESGFNQRGFAGGVIINRTHKGDPIQLGKDESKVEFETGINTNPRAKGDSSVIFEIPSKAKEFEGSVGLASGDNSCLAEGSDTATAKVYVFVDDEPKFEQTITAESNSEKFDIPVQGNQKIELRVKSDRNKKYPKGYLGHCNEIVWGDPIFKF